MLGGDASANEGDVKTYSYAVTDPGLDTHTVTTGCGANGDKESDDFLNRHVPVPLPGWSGHQQRDRHRPGL